MTNRAALESAVLDAMDSASTNVMRWGVDDCTLWGANIINAALGYNPAAWYRGRYSSRFGAARLIAANGGMIGLLRKAARQHGWKPIHPTGAKPGDVGLVWSTLTTTRKVQEQDPETLEFIEVERTVETPVLAVCICRARGWFVARNDRGFTAMRADNVACAWSVLDDIQDRNSVAPIVAGRFTPQPVHEPVSTFIGLTALITSFGASAAVAGAIGGAIVSGIVSIGFSLAASLLQPQRGSGNYSGSQFSDVQQAQGVQVTERNSIPYKQVIVGQAMVAGSVFFEQVKPPYLTIGLLLSYGKIDGIAKMRIGTNDLSFSSITENTILTPLGVDGQPNYASYLRLSVRYGDDDQAVDVLIANDYTSVGAEFRQRGNSTAVVRHHFGGTTQNDFLAVWGNVARPLSLFLVSGATCYDPRDPTQDINDESTWKWTNNATLIQAFYITRSWGGRIPMSKVRWDKIAESADYDDTVIACGDGTYIKRHTVDGVITLNQKPVDVVPKLLTANRGMLLESAGRVWVQSSQPRSPVVTIHDRLIASGIKYQAAKSKSDLINRLQVRAIAPDQDYQFVDGPILDDTAAQTADGEILTGTLALDFTLDNSPNWTRVQRLQKAFLATARRGRTLTVSVDVEILAIASDELIGNVATFDSILFSPANRDYLITGVGFAEDFTTVQLALTEYVPTIETDWDAAEDEQEFTLPPVNVS